MAAVFFIWYWVPPIFWLGNCFWCPTFLLTAGFSRGSWVLSAVLHAFLPFPAKAQQWAIQILSWWVRRCMLLLLFLGSWQSYQASSCWGISPRKSKCFKHGLRFLVKHICLSSKSWKVLFLLKLTGKSEMENDRKTEKKPRWVHENMNFSLVLMYFKVKRWIPHL